METRRAILFGQRKGTKEEVKDLGDRLNRATREQISDHGCGKRSRQVFEAQSGKLISDCDIVE